MGASRSIPSSFSALHRVALAALIASGAPLAFAQTPPPPTLPQIPIAEPGVIPSAEQLRRGKEETLPRPARDVEPPQPPQPPAREVGKPEDELTLDVTAYQVEGLSDVPPAVLAEITAPFTGKGRSYEDMVDAAAAVTRYVQRERGYYLGYAYLPEQTPEGGVIRIAVLEGRLDQVILNWPDDMPVQREVIERYLKRLQAGEILRVRDVERVVFLVNDLQGIRARFEVKAGRVPGTASLVVTPQAEPRFSGKAELDSYGSRYSGTGRLNVVGTIVSPLGRGDGLTLNALTSFTGGLKFGLVSYVLPIGADGLKIGISASKVNYQLDKDEFPQNLNGDATSVNLFGLYPLVRSRNLNAFVLGSYERKEFTDNRGNVSAFATEKQSDDVSVGLVGDFRDNLLTGGVSTFDAALLQGKIEYGSFLKPTDTPEHFTKIGLGFSRLQNLVSNRLLLYARYKGQLASVNLDTTERFSLGGPMGVRGYAPGEATGDEGHLLTAELRYLPPEQWFGRVSREMVFSAFYDWGHATFRKDPQASALLLGPNTATLSSIGIGAIWDRPQSFGMRLNLAWPVSGEATADPKMKYPRAYALVTKYF